MLVVVVSRFLDMFELFTRAVRLDFVFTILLHDGTHELQDLWMRRLLQLHCNVLLPDSFRQKCLIWDHQHLTALFHQGHYEAAISLRNDLHCVSCLGMNAWFQNTCQLRCVLVLVLVLSRTFTTLLVLSRQYGKKRVINLLKGLFSTNYTLKS